MKSVISCLLCNIFLPEHDRLQRIQSKVDSNVTISQGPMYNYLGFDINEATTMLRFPNQYKLQIMRQIQIQLFDTTRTTLDLTGLIEKERKAEGRINIETINQHSILGNQLLYINQRKILSVFTGAYARKSLYIVILSDRNAALTTISIWPTFLFTHCGHMCSPTSIMAGCPTVHEIESP